ncbi:MAG: hypothetical protein M1827_004830 [Pycnora praestabilis]|nr:MAG: hypothetical protein M1827_004830 [Pycnora praestabilis]
MAVRSAFALGLHREETMVIFGSEEQDLRRNLWRSLFVLDRFLSASLGRPAAICEDECSGDTLTPPDVPSHPPPPVTFNQTSTLGLEASVRSCSVIGIILKKVYQQRKISANLAQEIADQCKIWPKALAPSLHWRQASSRNPSQGIAILHVNLFYCHSIVLLTRPFFLFLLNAEIQKQSTNPHERANRFGSRMEKFSEACVIASSHTIQLVQSAFEGGYLQRRNPFVIYFLFAATLIVLSNEFSRLYANDSANQCINDVISVFAYCAESDPQAARLLFIMTAFRGAISSHVERSKARLNSHRNDPISKIRAPSNEAPQPYDAGATSFPSIETPSAPPDLPTPRNGSFSGLLDVNVLHNPVTGLSEESSAVDEQIDFDAFWNWPTTTPTAGIQSISDSTVPLFGMSDMS